ncbi:hypothetical protein ALI144C_02480 [Actinosynnema sp. ALI-1.44]|uniref:DNA methyltransferase n=1 Tax=Actinosynnema sp. ALI-1.44 TaxID=1933779 RepID=UPI00097C9D56|nr:DNA methyltransferase [Actinosynnema sp. ALI-1.44]ONI90569.1 hypothetical protein ALI144C_02480 [Actinosynnema sp. ALI-1.44]
MSLWSTVNVASVYRRLRDHTPAHATPSELAEIVVQGALDPLLSEAFSDPEPDKILELRVVDPACGTGEFLIAAARHITVWYARRRFGEATKENVARVMPDVLSQMIYGEDEDTVAIEVCKAALWLELSVPQALARLDCQIVHSTGVLNWR